MNEVEHLRAELTKSNVTILALAKQLAEVTARLTVIADMAAAGIVSSGIDLSGLGVSGHEPRDSP